MSPPPNNNNSLLPLRLRLKRKICVRVCMANDPELEQNGGVAFRRATGHVLQSILTQLRLV